ncbi:hypothetical protein HOLleu_35800 [Holothuria leucospilota]|uniref:Uncharacterized protein n=1 Tax=Holothuria leucospilota TaxID=206669 RepID=A0A9Q1BE79_HOLLE|nr:hypothetical protein HOLleu_35800 [Holothuria leucospilota]
MNPPSQQVFLGNQQHPPAAPGLFVNPTIPDGKLWGSNVRRSMGITQIICGGIEFVFGIAVICVPSYYFDGLDYVGWGIWTGVFAIVAGFLGVFSQKKKGMVIAYMITSIITAVLCAGCFIYAVFGALYSSFILKHGYREGADLALYIILCIVFFIHMVISIIGASFTCGALSPATNQSQQVVNYTPQPLHQPYVPAPPYTVAVAQSGITFQTTTPMTNGAFVSPVM